MSATFHSLMSDVFDLEGRIFNEARRLPAAERIAYLRQACAGDTALRQQVEELLVAVQETDAFLQQPARGIQRPSDASPSPSRNEFGPPSPLGLLKSAGDRGGRYNLLQQIGEGGCGVVYMAEQIEPMRRHVALKVIKLGMDTKGVVARFDAERQALALMDHPNIAKVFDAGATETGRPFFVMELVRGTPITRYCDEHTLSTSLRLGIFIQVCKAIQHAHQKGIIHRDLKPSNILLTDHDGAPVPKIIDFGIAKATAGQILTDLTVFTAIEQFIGTPAYMSPEQAALSGLDIDTRSDIYSLGVLLYELLTGETPFEARRLLHAGLDEMRRIIRQEEPSTPSTRLQTLGVARQNALATLRQCEPPRLLGMIRGDLDWIVMKALEKDRARRYDTANGVALDIERYLNHQPVSARPPSAAYLVQKWTQRNKGTFASAIAVMAALMLGTGISTWLFLKERQARRRALAAEHVQNQLHQQAETQALRAEAASAEVKNTLAASDFLQAVRLSAEDDPNEALAYLDRILSMNPSNAAALVRLASLLSYHSWMIPTIIVTQSNWIRSVQFSPDGKYFLTASFDGTARVWNATSGEPVTPLLNHGGPIESAQFSPDGKQVVTASDDHTARVWDAQSGQPLAGPFAHADAVYSAQFSPDGTELVTASRDGTAQAWNSRTGLPLSPPLRHASWVVSAQFSPDGARIVTAAYDNTARVWSSSDGHPITGPLTHRGWVSAAQFSPDGTRIVTASYDGSARVWDAKTGQPLTEPLKHGDRVRAAQFSPDGKRVVTASFDRTSQIWDAQSGQPLTPPLTHRAAVWFARFSPDGKRVVTASFDNTARIWDAETGQPLTESLRHGSAIWSVQFSPDGRRILTASDDNTARVWEAQNGPVLAEPLRHQGWVNSAQFSGDGKRIVTSSDDSTARVWDAGNGRPLTASLRHEGRVTAAQFSPDGQRLVTASEDHTARLWDARSGQPLAQPLRHGAGVVAAQFSPYGKRVVTASADHTARVWDAQTGQPLTGSLNHGDKVVAAQFSPDGTRVVTASFDHTAIVWNARTGQPLIEPLKHNDEVWSARFSPDGTRIITTSSDHTARVWDARSGVPLTPPLRHGDAVKSAQFSPDGRTIVTASWDKTARIWDAQSGQPLTAPLKHGDAVLTAEFSPDGKLIVTASDDSTLRVWDAQSGQPLTEPWKHGGAVVSAQFSPDGARIVSASRDFAGRVWDVAPRQAICPEWLLQLSEAISGQLLNHQSFLEESRLNRASALNKIREELQGRPHTDSWAAWGRWFLAAPATRTISPFSTLSVPRYVENRLRENTIESLVQAEQLADGNPEIAKRIADRRAALEKQGRAVELQRQAQELEAKGDLSGAENQYREALALTRQLWAEDSQKWPPIADRLAAVLILEGKVDGGEQLFKYLSTDSFENGNQGLGLLRSRARFRARAGQWNEAAADFSKVIQLNPADHVDFHCLAPLLVQSGQLDLFRHLCQQALERFGQTDDPPTADRIAKDCLILPASGSVLRGAAKLADIAVTRGKDHPYVVYFQFVKGLAAYRQGQYAPAVEWTQKALPQSVKIPNLELETRMVLAMAQFGLNQTEKAHASLASGIEIARTRLPNLDSRDFTAEWIDWIIGHKLMQEATELIEGRSAAVEAGVSHP